MTAPRVLLITGAGRGIGAACALRAAEAGWDVGVNFHRDEAAAEQVVAQVRARGRRACALRADVASEGAIEAMFKELDAELGPLGGLVNNAGIVDVAARVDEMSAARIARLFNVNVVGAFVCAREAVRRMSTRHGGRGGVVVNLSSAAARLGSPGIYVDYAATKAAIDNFTLGLAREVADEGIRVNGVRPGAAASSRPTSTPPAACWSARRRRSTRSRCGAWARPTKWPRPSSSCCRTRPAT